MDTLEIVYYTCTNNECPKHRSVFMEGDAQHEGCARECVWLEGQRRPASRLLWLAIPVALSAAVAGGMLLLRSLRNAQFKPPMLREEPQMKTWSGAEAHRDEREGNPVPPPMV